MVLGETKGRNRERSLQHSLSMTKIVYLAFSEPGSVNRNLDFSDYVSLAELLNESGPEQLLKSWINDVKTLEYLATWEHEQNPKFDMDALIGMWVKASLGESQIDARDWVKQAKGVGIYVSRKFPGKIYLHRDIAFHLKSYLYPELRYEWIRCFQDLLYQMPDPKDREWNFRTWLARQLPRKHNLKVSIR